MKIFFKLSDGETRLNPSPSLSESHWYSINKSGPSPQVITPSPAIIWIISLLKIFTRAKVFPWRVYGDVDPSFWPNPSTFQQPLFYSFPLRLYFHFDLVGFPLLGVLKFFCHIRFPSCRADLTLKSSDICHPVMRRWTRPSCFLTFFFVIQEFNKKKSKSSVPSWI